MLMAACPHAANRGGQAVNYEMQLKLFILPVKNLSAAEAEMNAFLRSHRVLAVKREFVGDDC